MRALIASLDFLSEFELERLSEFEQRGDYTSGRPRTV